MIEDFWEKANFILVLTLLLSFLFIQFQTHYWDFIPNDYLLGDLEYHAHDADNIIVSQLQISRYALGNFPASVYYRLSEANSKDVVFNHVEEHTFEQGYVNRTFYLPLGCDFGCLQPGEYYWAIYITIELPTGHTRTIVRETNIFTVG